MRYSDYVEDLTLNVSKRDFIDFAKALDELNETYLIIWMRIIQSGYDHDLSGEYGLEISEAIEKFINNAEKKKINFLLAILLEYSLEPSLDMFLEILLRYLLSRDRRYGGNGMDTTDLDAFLSRANISLRVTIREILLSRFMHYVSISNLSNTLDMVFVPVDLKALHRFVSLYILRYLREFDVTIDAQSTILTTLAESFQIIRTFLEKHNVDPATLPIPDHEEFSTHEATPLVLKIFRNVFDSSLWALLRKKVRGNLFTYVWDQFCRTFGSGELEKYRNLAREFGIQNVENMNKAQLCVEFNKLPLSVLQQDAANCNLDDTDPWSLDNIGDIPPFRRYKIGHQCFDLNSLEEAIKRKEKVNPFTREQLPLEDIQRTLEKSSRMLRTDENFLNRMRATPLLTKQAHMSQLIGNIWSKLPYPTSPENFLAASETELNNMWKEMLQYDVLPVRSMSHTFANSADKHLALLNILQRLVDLPEDEYANTRYLAIATALNNNIKARRHRDQEDDDDFPISQRLRLEGGRKRRPYFARQ